MKESLHFLNIDKADGLDFEKWHQLAKERMPNVHVNRHREWALARLCLELCLREQGFQFKPSDLVFKNYHFIEKLDQFSFSLSHTKTWAAALLVPVNLARQVGVDIELNNRKVPDNVKHRLANPQDDHYDPLHLWVIKEAAYKSLPPLAQQGVWLNHIFLKGNTFELQHTPFKGRFEMHETGELIIAKAYYE